jgi:hypothetical protein
LIDGTNVDDDPVVVVVDPLVVDSVLVVASVDVCVVSVAVALVSVELESVAEVVVSAAVELLSDDPETAETMPSAPEAITPAQRRAPNARATPVRRSVFRPFIPPAPLLPQMRRMP